MLWENMTKLFRNSFDLAFNLAFLAIETKSLEPLQKLREMIVGKEVDANAWVDEITLLGKVAEAGDQELVSLMLGLVDDVNFRKVERVVTPLMDAAGGQSIEIVRLLIDYGSDPNIVREGTFALECAAQAGRDDIFDFLLPLTHQDFHKSAKRTMDSIKEKSSREPLNKDTLELFELLRRSDVSKIKIVKAISKGANVNAYDDSDSTILMRACDRCSADIIQVLLKAGADPNLGQPIFRAFSYNKYYVLDVTKTLVHSGANVNTAYHDGVCPLMIASHYNTGFRIKAFQVGYDLCDFLISSGANLNQTTQYGCTSLMFAARSGDIQIVKLLIEKGANVNLRDNKGMSVLDYAKTSFYVKESGDTNLIQFLESIY